MALKANRNAAAEIEQDEEVIEAEVEVEINVPAPRAPAHPPKKVEALNEDFGGIGNVQTFLPAIVLSQDGEFEFKASGATVPELEFTPLRGRDCLSYWDEEAQVFIKSYDGRTDEDGDDFSPYLKKARRTYEIECMQVDPEGDSGEELHMIRCSPTMAIAFKSVAAALSAKDVSVKNVVFTAKPARAKSKKHRVKFWTWELTCKELSE